jgi:hypothetical protein
MHRGTWAWRREEWRCINSITASKPPTAHPLITFQKLRVAAEDAGGASGFTRCSGAQVQHHVILLPHGPARSPLYLPLHPFNGATLCTLDRRLSEAEPAQSCGGTSS